MPSQLWSTVALCNRRLGSVCLVVGVALASAAALECDSKPPVKPVAYHSPNIVWNGSDFAVSWATRDDEARVLFGVLGQGGWKTPPTRISRKAYETDPPLIGSDGNGFLMAWTHEARRKAGLYVRELSAAGKGGKEALIFDGPVTLCRQLLWADDAYSMAWIAETGVFFGRFDPKSSEPLATIKIDGALRRMSGEDGLVDCRLAWSGTHYGLLLGERTAAGNGTLHFFSLDRSWEIAGRTVIAGDDTTVRSQELVWNGAAFVAVYTSDGERGAGMARLAVDADVQWRGALPGATGYVRGVGIAPSATAGLIWSESETADAVRGHVYFGLMPGEQRLSQRTRLTEAPNGRFVVNAAGTGTRLGIGWSIDIRHGGEVRWRTFNLERRADDHEVRAVVSGATANPGNADPAGSDRACED